jgi:hypothetical protein
MSESAARSVLLVRAIESEDHDALLLTREDRQFATRSALAQAPLGAEASTGQTGAFLERRAALVLERLTPRYPNLSRLSALSRWPAWLSWGAPVAAFAIGLVAHQIDGDRFNILAFPLLGMLAWNAFVYGWILLGGLIGRLLPKRETSTHPLRKLIERIGRPAVARLAAQPTLERAGARFGRDWSRVAGPLTHHRVARTLHLGAAMFAAGVLLGMLFRARYGAEYSAGWSGTWAGAEREIADLLHVILGPASWLTGIALPDAAQLARLRGHDENAGHWLVLWSVTGLGFVIIPRLLLAAWNAARTALGQRRMAVPGGEDFYVRSVLRDALGRPGIARVVPYAFHPPVPARERLERLLAKALGNNTRVGIDAAVEYGAEDRWLKAEGDRLGAADQLVLLFALGSTPEAENHGAFANGARQALGGGTGLTLLLDDSGMRHTLRGQASAERRLEERLAAWQTVLAPVGIAPVVVSLELGEDEVSARKLERALLRTPVPA